MQCTSFARGHNVHYIQANLAHKRPGEIKKVCVLGHDGHWLTFEMDGHIHRMWNHDPAQVRAFHNQAVALQSIPHTASCPLYFTSVNLMIARHDETVMLYADPEGPTDCDDRPNVFFLNVDRDRE